jgi:predicted methyltransferase
MTVPEFSFGLRKIDMVLTFRNAHNFDAAGRANLNAAAFEVLNKGGRYAIVDHTRRHMQPDSAEVWRRLDPVQVIKEVQAAGFKFVDYSDLHYKPDDELRHEVGRQSVTGNTDRFTLLFEKP